MSNTFVRSATISIEYGENVNDGKIKPLDARMKLERTHAEMAEAERKNDSFKQMPARFRWNEFF